MQWHNEQQRYFTHTDKVSSQLSFAFAPQPFLCEFTLCFKFGSHNPKVYKMPPADMTRSVLRGFTCLSAEMQMRSIICHKLHSGNNRLLHHVISSSQHPPTEVAALLIVRLSTPALLFLIAPKSNWGCDIAFVATGWIKTKVQVTI